LGTATLNASGVASYTTSAIQLAAGSHSISAAYGGDANFSGSDDSASPLTETISRAATSTGAVTASANPSTSGQAVTFTATVSAAGPGAGMPTGTVTFYDGSTALGSVSLSLVNGLDQATFATSSLAVGAHSISASYGGDANFS